MSPAFTSSLEALLIKVMSKCWTQTWSWVDGEKAQNVEILNFLPGYTRLTTNINAEICGRYNVGNIVEEIAYKI